MSPFPPSLSPVLVVAHDQNGLDATRDALSFGRLVNPVLACADISDVQDYLSSDSPPPAVVVTELHLPTGDAADVLRLIRTNVALRRTPVVVISEGASADDISTVTALGATAYLDRGVAVDVLVGVLRDADLPWAITPPAAPAPVSARRLLEVAR